MVNLATKHTSTSCVCRLNATGVSETDIFASSTCNFNIVTLDRMKKKKYNPIVGNIGHFDDEIDLARLGAWKA